MEDEKLSEVEKESKIPKKLSFVHTFFRFILRVFVEAPELILIPVAGIFVLFKFKSAILEKVIEFFN